MDEFLGTNYILVESVNVEDYYTYIGVGYFARKVALTLKQTVRLTRNEDGSYEFEFIPPLASSTLVFKLGEEIEEVRPDGVKLKSVITITDNVMTHIQTHNNGKTMKHIREFYANKMTTTTTAEDLDKTVKRYYVAQ